jgi:hypothetical protein
VPWTVLRAGLGLGYLERVGLVGAWGKAGFVGLGWAGAGGGIDALPASPVRSTSVHVRSQQPLSVVFWSGLVCAGLVWVRGAVFLVHT